MSGMKINAPHNKKETVRSELISWLGRASVGERLLPERQLAELFKVSRPTIRLAMKSLVKDGYLERVQGRGIFVTRSMSCKKRTFCLAFRQEKEELNFPFQTLLIRCLIKEIPKHKCSFQIVSSDDKESMADLSASDGVIALCQIDQTLIPEGKPVVAIFHPGYRAPSLLQILIDDHLGGFEACRHLTELGHRRIAFLGDIELHDWARERYRGVCSAVSETGLPAPILLKIKDVTRVGADLIKEIKKKNVTGIVCANDHLAMVLISSLHASGMKIPEDISVIGFDDIAVAPYLYPPLTTMRLPVAEAASIAVKELMEMSSTTVERFSRKILLPVELVVRESCRAI